MLDVGYLSKVTILCNPLEMQLFVNSIVLQIAFQTTKIK